MSPISAFDGSARPFAMSHLFVGFGPPNVRSANPDHFAIGLILQARGAASTARQPAIFQPAERMKKMATITTRDGTRIFYKDWGSRNAQPILFSHGLPLTADVWDAQMVFFA